MSPKSNSHIPHPLLRLYKGQCIFQFNHFNFVQRCIQISTRINSSMYIRTSVFVSFETYPILHTIFLNITNLGSLTTVGFFQTTCFRQQPWTERYSIDAYPHFLGHIRDVHKWSTHSCTPLCCAIHYLACSAELGSIQEWCLHLLVWGSGEECKGKCYTDKT